MPALVTVALVEGRPIIVVPDVIEIETGLLAKRQGAGRVERPDCLGIVRLVIEFTDISRDRAGVEGIGPPLPNFDETL